MILIGWLARAKGCEDCTLGHANARELLIVGFQDLSVKAAWKLI